MGLYPQYFIQHLGQIREEKCSTFNKKGRQLKVYPERREFDENINFGSSHEIIGLSANGGISVSASVELTLKELKPT